MKRAISAVVALTSVTAASAAVHRVPEDYATIYEAVDVAAAGDSVLIGPGTWTERDTRRVVHNGGFSTRRAHAFLKPGLTIVGTTGSASTILLGDELGASYFSTIMDFPDSPPGDPIVLRGLTLIGRVRSGGLPGYRGIFATGRAAFELYDCVLERNTTAIFSEWSSLLMRECVFRQNDATSLDVVPSGINGRGGDWDFEGCLFESNVAGRVLLRHGGTGGSAIRNCRFIGNEGGKVVRLYDQLPLLIEDNWFEGNVCPENQTGTCLDVSDCDGLIAGNTFVNNQQPGNGNGVLSVGGGTHAASV
ncbi:right-handed parallel beta-helix repeat-containing protein, partial [bacterium]|nr:right-handed parallel beta-helix repeat-containing protein [bacterium]